MDNNHVPAFFVYEREDACHVKKPKTGNTVRCRNQRSYARIRMTVFRPERHVLSCCGILSNDLKRRRKLRKGNFIGTFQPCGRRLLICFKCGVLFSLAAAGGKEGGEGPCKAAEGHCLENDLSGPCDDGVEDPLAAEQHVFDPLDGDNVNRTGGVHHR